MADSKQTPEQKQELKDAQAAAPTDAELADIARRVPPLVRDDEHSFVPEEDLDRETDPELIQPNLTDTSMAEVEAEYLADEGNKLKMTRPDRAKSTYEISSAIGEVDLERMSDEQIKDSGVLKKASPRFHPARLAPSSDRPRQPGSTAPAAGAGSWPVHEGQMPAVMPTDPPVEDAEDREAPDNGFANAAGFTRAKDGTLKRKGLTIEKNEVAGAAALYLRLRQQFPAVTSDQLADEFELQWLSGNSGAPQSHRAGEELSQQGLTEVGDDRVTHTNLGELRATSDRAFEADPEQAPPDIPGTGAPSENEPASTAVDAAKEPSGETVAADKQAAAEFAKFDGDGNGLPGGSKPKAK